MGLFSFLSKNKQESAEGGKYSGSDEDEAIGARARSKRASNAGEPAARRKDGKAAADPVLPEKKRARRRLVGAIALALAVAIGLPMVLDAEPKPIAGDIDIRIPPKNKVAAQEKPRPVAPAETLDRREEIVDLPVTPAPAPKPVARVEPKPVEVKPVEPKPVERKVVEHKVSEPKPVEPKPAPVPAVPKAVAKAPEEKPPVKPVVKPVNTPDSARAISILEDKAPEAVIEESNQKYVVQVAALATQEKVTELQEKLKAAGIRSYTQKVPSQSGDRIRVRVGPFSKEEAEKVRAKLSKLGLSGSMVPT